MNDNDIFIVNANFNEFGETWSVAIGAFNDEELANSKKKKWLKFFEENKHILAKPSDFEPSEDGEEWDESDRYYNLLINFEIIRSFVGISIEKLKLNSDNFIENIEYKKTDKFLSLVKEWDRDYKLNEIL